MIFSTKEENFAEKLEDLRHGSISLTNQNPSKGQEGSTMIEIATLFQNQVHLRFERNQNLAGL